MFQHCLRSSTSRWGWTNMKNSASCSIGWVHTITFWKSLAWRSSSKWKCKSACNCNVTASPAFRHQLCAQLAALYETQTKAFTPFELWVQLGNRLSMWLAALIRLWMVVEIWSTSTLHHARQTPIKWSSLPQSFATVDSTSWTQAPYHYLRESREQTAY